MNPFTRGSSIQNGIAQLLRVRVEFLHDLMIELSSGRLSQQPIIHHKSERCRSPVKPLPICLHSPSCTNTPCTVS